MMKNRLTIALLATTAVVAIPAHAYTSGDLLVGFGQAGAANDYVYDVGSLSSITVGQTWNLSTGLFGQFSTLSNLNFGVVGSLNSSQTIFSSTAGIAPVEVNNGYQTIRADIYTIGGSITAGNALTPAQTATTSWTYETRQPAGTPGGIFQNDLDNPNVVTPAAFTSGSTVAYLFANDNLADPAVFRCAFSLDSAGILTYVPEPATCALLGLGALAFMLRRRMARA
jgi:hypothetical protein